MRAKASAIWLRLEFSTQTKSKRLGRKPAADDSFIRHYRAILSYQEILATPNLPSARARRGSVRCVLWRNVAAARRRLLFRGRCRDCLCFFARLVSDVRRDLRSTRRNHAILREMFASGRLPLRSPSILFPNREQTIRSHSVDAWTRFVVRGDPLSPRGGRLFPRRLSEIL